MDVGLVARVRRFHRSVTQRIGALEDDYLHRGRPLGEARVLWEIGPDGSDVRMLRTRLGLEALLLTRGHEGMTLYSKNRSVHVKAEAREVFDVSGAGDTVIATLATMLAAGLRLEQAMRIANRAGGIKVGKLGTAVVTRKELFG